MNPLHYPSLELCKKLTSSNFPKTEKCWTRSLKWNEESKKFPYEISSRPTPWGYYVAASVMELLDELPTMIEKDWEKYFICTAGKYIVIYSDYIKGNLHKTESYNLADWLAEMWLWLKENDLLPKK